MWYKWRHLEPSFSSLDAPVGQFWVSVSSSGTESRELSVGQGHRTAASTLGWGESEKSLQPSSLGWPGGQGAASELPEGNKTQTKRARPVPSLQVGQRRGKQRSGKMWQSQEEPTQPGWAVGVLLRVFRALCVPTCPLHGARPSFGTSSHWHSFLLQFHLSGFPAGLTPGWFSPSSHRGRGSPALTAGRFFTCETPGQSLECCFP